MNPGRTQLKTKPGLHVCPHCRSDLVQPTRWEQAEPHGSWKLWRRCPDCEWDGASVHGEADANPFVLCVP